jgi:hypothetical protein
MTNLATQWHTAALTAYDFSRFRRVVDIGGGHGALLSAILSAHPQLRGVLFDQPHVVEGAKPRLRAGGLTQRCELVGGNFFDSVPAGGDLYLLGHILIDWEDTRAITILQNIRQAIALRRGSFILRRPQGRGRAGEIADSTCYCRRRPGARSVSFALCWVKVGLSFPDHPTGAPFA